jgi:hypothetical protein
VGEGDSVKAGDDAPDRVEEDATDSVEEDATDRVEEDAATAGIPSCRLQNVTRRFSFSFKRRNIDRRAFLITSPPGYEIDRSKPMDLSTFSFINLNNAKVL